MLHNLIPVAFGVVVGAVAALLYLHTHTAKALAASAKATADVAALLTKAKTL